MSIFLLDEQKNAVNVNPGGPVAHPCPTGPSTHRERLNTEFSHWLNGLTIWTEWFTGTFEGEYTEWSAHRAFERWAAKEAPQASWFYVTERNPNRAGHHVHALFGDCYGQKRRDWWKTWFERYGRCKIEPVADRKKVEAYCSKHCVNYLLKGDGWFNLRIQEQRQIVPDPDKLQQLATEAERPTNRKRKTVTKTT